jgi:hypothetical protein
MALTNSKFVHTKFCELFSVKKGKKQKKKHGKIRALH